MNKMRIIKWAAVFLLVWLIFLIALNLIFRPTHDRIWEPGHEALPYIAVTDEDVTITNYRHFKWSGPVEAVTDYETKTFLLSDIIGVSVVISHFSDFEGLAHIFVSFELANDTPIVISLETRREVGEKFSPLLGVLRQFEIIYVVGDERDLVGVRTDHRDERVYLYPTKASAEQAQTLFLRLANKVNAVYAEPQMYNTLFRNCTNEITREVELMTDLDFPLTWKTIAPGYFDEILYEMKMIDTTLPLTETKQKHLLDTAHTSDTSDSYSQDIRTNPEAN